MPRSGHAAVVVVAPVDPRMLDEEVPVSSTHEADWTAAWEEMLGSVPQVARDLREISAPAEASYRGLRQWIYSDRPGGLPRSVKELIMVVINIAEGNPAGAVIHLKLGAQHGLSQMQLSEALAQSFLSLGVIRFNAAGLAAWQAFKDVGEQKPTSQSTVDPSDPHTDNPSSLG